MGWGFEGATVWVVLLNSGSKFSRSDYAAACWYNYGGLEIEMPEKGH